MAFLEILSTAMTCSLVQVCSPESNISSEGVKNKTYYKMKQKLTMTRYLNAPFEKYSHWNFFSSLVRDFGKSRRAFTTANSMRLKKTNMMQVAIQTSIA